MSFFFVHEAFSKSIVLQFPKAYSLEEAKRKCELCSFFFFGCQRVFATRKVASFDWFGDLFWSVFFLPLGLLKKNFLLFLFTLLFG